ncbi:protein Jade-1 [Gouania willdenowi]|uniref:Protein Jade-1 n=1 Tax=Gouania willdenowi TaxID=441366 RepID=A0A8C5NEH4_GOUWI|nr:protein Jade-1 [Gouania willdenowi]XP_028293343.1 protein Jade-1 [Gouania willdenowi]
MKRSRHNSSSDESDNGSNSTCWSQHSSHPRRGTGQKPSEVFRTDLITAMKVHDSHQLNTEDFYILADPWRQDWEKGVQVPVSPHSIPQPVTRVLAEKAKEVMFVRPKKMIQTSGSEALGYVDIRTLAEGMCRYDLNEEDVAWLQIINQEFAEMALPPLDEITMERVMEEFEHRCHDNMTHAVETEEGLGIEYDEDVVCDVCQSPDGEDNNEMVFCDKCNICVHQACYGIQKVPKGSWLCRICALGILPKCQLCPKKGGAMKPTRSGTKWVHVSCALWIPEVSIGNPEKMEPITNVSHIPTNRWALICCLCKEKTGACIQCSAKNCRTAFHVTCGLHASLEMKTMLTDDDEVKFKSFCPKHSGLESGEDVPSEEQREGIRDGKSQRRGRVKAEEEPHSLADNPETLSQREQEKRVSLRKMKLQEMEEEFFQFVEAKDVSARLKLPLEAVDFLFQYWKLKRKANFNQPLITPKKDEEESLARREQDVLLRRLQLFTHLRQDLERVRNLTYMVTRREKMKRSLWKVEEQIFQQKVRLLDQELLNGDPSQKDLEELFSSAFTSSQSNSCWNQKNKHGSSKQERRKSNDRKSPSDRKYDHSRPHDSREGRNSGVKAAAEAVLSSDSGSRTAFPKETSAVKVLKPEGRKSFRREADQEVASRPKQDEQEDRRTRRRSEVTESRLEKTVSIRLVDIRNSDVDDFFFHEGGVKRSFITSDVSCNNTKLNKVVSEVKSNGVLRKHHINGSHSSSDSAHLKSWGKFRIPKRSDKTPSTATTKDADLRKPQLRLLNKPVNNAAERGAKNRELDSRRSDSEHLKRCHSHQLRDGSALSRRYGSEFIRRGVLAS